MGGGVLKGDLGLLVVVDVGEFVGVLVGEEEEVWPDTLKGVSVKSSRTFAYSDILWQRPLSETLDQGHHGWW